MRNKLIMKRFAIILLIPLIIIALLWSGVWFFASNFLVKNYLQNNVLNAKMGKIKNIEDEFQDKINCAQIKVKGFPFSFNIECENGQFIDGDKNFQLANLTIKYSFFSPLKAKIIAKSPLSYSNAFFASKQEFRWTNLTINIALNGWHLQNIKIKGEDFAYIDKLFGEYLILDAKNIDIFMANDGESSSTSNILNKIDITANIDEINLANFQIENAQLLLNAQITNLETDIRAWANNALIKKWQQNNGKLIISQFTGKEENKEFSVKGNIGLDENGYLSGALAINSNNIVELIAPNFPPDIQPIIFGSQNENGSYSQNINLRDGTIYSGLFPIGQLAPLL